VDAAGKIIMSDDDYVDTWKEMEKCVDLGLTKSIGISNFNSEQSQRVLDIARIKPVTNQVNFKYLMPVKYLSTTHFLLYLYIAAYF